MVLLKLFSIVLYALNGVCKPVIATLLCEKARRRLSSIDCYFVSQCCFGLLYHDKIPLSLSMLGFVRIYAQYLVIAKNVVNLTPRTRDSVKFEFSHSV